MERIFDFQSLVGVSDSDVLTIKDTLKGVNFEISNLNRRTLALAVVMGAMLGIYWDRLGKGKFGRWRRGIGIAESTASRYTNIYKKWVAMIGSDPHKPGCPTFQQALGVSILGLPAAATVPIPDDWRNKTFEAVAYPKPEKDDGPPQCEGVNIEVDWIGPEIPAGPDRHRLDPDRWKTDLLHPACPERVPPCGVELLAKMLEVALVRLRDQGEWDACRSAILALVKILAVVYRTVDGEDADIASMLEVREESEDEPEFVFDGGRAELPRNPEVARRRELERLAGAHQEMEAKKPENIRRAVIGAYEGMAHPMTADELAEEASGFAGVLVSVHQVRRALGGAHRWQFDKTRYHPPLFDARDVDEDEQRDIAEEAGWVRPKSEYDKMAARKLERTHKSIDRRLRKKARERKKRCKWARVGDVVRMLVASVDAPDNATPVVPDTFDAGEVWKVNDIKDETAAIARFQDGRRFILTPATYGTTWEFVDQKVAKRRDKHLPSVTLTPTA